MCWCTYMCAPNHVNTHTVCKSVYTNTPNHTHPQAAAMADHDKNGSCGVPVMVQQKQIQLGTMRMWVQSLASLSGLGIQHGHELRCRSHAQLGSGIAVAAV